MTVMESVDRNVLSSLQDAVVGGFCYSIDFHAVSEVFLESFLCLI